MLLAFLPGANLAPIVSPPTQTFRIALSSREFPSDASSREVSSRAEQSTGKLVVGLDETNDYNHVRMRLRLARSGSARRSES